MYVYNWITLLCTWNWHNSVNQLCCSVAQLCLILCNPMDCNAPGFPVLHSLLELPTLMSTESVMSSNHLVLVSSCLQSFPASGSFLMSWLFTSGGQSRSFSFSISPSNEYSGLISFSIDWFDLLAKESPKDSPESSPIPQFKSINSLELSLSYGSTLTSIHNYWKNHSVDYMDLCRQNNISAF